MTEEAPIVINKRDLRDPHIEEMLQMEQAARRPLTPTERAPVETALWLNPIVYTSVAGLLGAILAWAVIEPLITKTARNETGIGLVLMIPIAAALIGCFVGLIEGIMSRNISKAARCGGIGLGIGLAWGIAGMILGGIVIQMIWAVGASMFISRPPGPVEDPLALLTPGMVFMIISGRALAWTIVGAGMGVGQGWALGSKKLFLNGLVGGLLGGFLGGLVFDPIGLVLTKTGLASSGAVSRLIGLGIIGAMVGIFIGLVENLTKDAWLVMKSGALRGKQFVIYHNPTVIGSSPKCDIYIFKDPAVEPKHAEIRQVGGKFELVDNKSPQGVFVNAQRITRKILEKGDVIVIGESLLEFQQKERA